MFPEGKMFCLVHNPKMLADVQGGEKKPENIHI